MPLAKSHSLPKKEERKPKPCVYNSKVIVNIQPYSKAEHLVELVYCDILNGTSKYQIVKKLMEAVYEGMEKGYSRSQADNYYKAAMNRIKADADLKVEEARQVLLGRFETVYNDALLLGDKQSALRALENIAKVYGIDGKTPQTAIQINNNSSGMTISFGFDNAGKTEEISDSEPTL